MNYLKSTLVLLLFIPATIGTTNGQMIQHADEQPYIEVTGTAEKGIIPDEIYINITLLEKSDNKQKLTITQQEENLKAAMQGIGIKPENLSLTDAHADYIKVRWGSKEIVTRKDYTLKVSDAATVAKVFTELEKLLIEDAQIIRTTHSKMDSLTREVKIEAIKAAKTKADYLLAAIGEKTGKPLIVRETEGMHMANVSGTYTNTYRGGRVDMEQQYEPEIQFNKIKLRSGIYVKFLVE